MNNQRTRGHNWKASTICAFAGITRSALGYWAKTVYPKDPSKILSSEDVLVYMIIKAYVTQHCVKLSRLREINWNALVVELEKLKLSGLTNKILNVNLINNTYGLHDSLAEFKHNKIYNHFVELKDIFLEFENKFENVN